MYDPQLAERQWIVVANKMDLHDAKENLRAFKRRFRKREVIPISADKSDGLEELKTRLRELIITPDREPTAQNVEVAEVPGAV